MTSRLSAVEVASALARRCREGTFTVSERDRALGAVEEDLSALHVVEISPSVVARSRGLLLRHPLRARDAIQLASALLVQRELDEPVPFVAYDDRLRAAAAVEGLTVVR